MSAVVEFSEWKRFDVDIVILADSSWVSKHHGFNRKVEIDKFISDVTDEDSCLVIYPYTYIEYSDPYDNVYNAILIEHCKLRFTKDNDIYHAGDTMVIGMERMKWDVKIN